MYLADRPISGDDTQIETSAYTYSSLLEEHLQMCITTSSFGESLLYSSSGDQRQWKANNTRGCSRSYRSSFIGARQRNCTTTQRSSSFGYSSAYPLFHHGLRCCNGCLLWTKLLGRNQRSISRKLQLSGCCYRDLWCRWKFNHLRRAPARVSQGTRRSDGSRTTCSCKCSKDGSRTCRYYYQTSRLRKDCERSRIRSSCYSSSINSQTQASSCFSTNSSCYYEYLASITSLAVVSGSIL